MDNKICGKCTFYNQDYHYCMADKERKKVDLEDSACKDFTPKTMTVGDRIRALSDEELAKLFVYWDEDWLSYESTILESESFGFDEAKAIEATIKELKRVVTNE